MFHKIVIITFYLKIDMELTSCEKIVGTKIFKILHSWLNGEKKSKKKRKRFTYILLINKNGHL